LTNKKAIVIGSGIAGIAASIRLAVKGYDVEVLEANDYPGGKLSQIEQDGFRFDAGPSLFTMPELVDELFDLAQKNPKDFFQYDRLSTICRYYFADGTVFNASGNAQTFATEAAQFFGVPHSRITNYLNHSRYLYNTVGPLFLFKSLHKFETYFSWSTFWSFLQLPMLNTMSSMNAVNEKKLKNIKLVQLFNRYATYNGSNPYVAPGILNLIPHLEFHRGAYYPKHGMYSITKSLVALAESLEVKFRYKHMVSSILVDKGKACGVEVNNEKIIADCVVCNMDIVPTFQRLMPQQKQPKHILKQERSSSALIFYWGINHEFPELSLHNIMFSEDYQKEFETIFTQKTIAQDPTIYINITSKMTPEDAPKGMENWFVMVNTPCNEGQDWDILIAEARKNIMLKISKTLGRNIESLIVSESILDPRIIESKTSSYRGALYGTSSNSRLAAFFRHPNFSKEIKNLYFCGGSVHPGGGIPLALSSAKIVASCLPS